MTNKHEKIHPMSLAIREMQIVPMLGHLYTPTRTDKIKNNDSAKCWQN